MSPGSEVQSIMWLFNSANPDLTSMPVNISDPDVLVESAGGTSVLVLDNVGVDRQGIYHCEALLTNGSTIVSDTANLVYSGEFDMIEDFISFYVYMT